MLPFDARANRIQATSTLDACMGLRGNAASVRGSKREVLPSSVRANRRRAIALAGACMGLRGNAASAQGSEPEVRRRAALAR